MQLCIVVTGNRQETIKGDGLGKVMGEENLEYCERRDVLGALTETLE